MNRMNRKEPPPASDANEEVAALIETLHQAERRLEELTAGEVDTVADREGRTMLLRRSQDHLRHHEAAKQAAVLNALPAHVALLDAQGHISSVNEAWQRFAVANALRGPAYGIGLNYLDICDRARGGDASEAHRAAAGIRSVLSGELGTFSMEYPCHSPTERRWFLMTASPMAAVRPHGVVVMHVDITDRKEAEDRVGSLNRVYCVLSGINALIVRVCDRDELFREACQIVVEAGGLRMAWIGIVDPVSTRIVPVASAGVGEELVTLLKERYASTEDAPPGMPLTSRAFREKRAVVINDLQSSPAVELGKELTELGMCSLAILPLLVPGGAVGVFVLYAGESEFFHEEEVKLLMDLAGDVGFAVDHIAKQERLDYLAYYDALTGLANRSLFLERVAQFMRGAATGGYKVALFLIDLKRFKNINDSLGRSAGDALLRQVAEWLTRIAGDANLLARVGADHFAAALPEARQEGAVARFLEKTMKSFVGHPFRLDDTVVQVGVQVGVALFPEDGTDAAGLFGHAEAALKTAKARGDRYLFYRREMTKSVAGKLTLENQLRRALDNGQFVLHYQPKVNLTSGKLNGAEALIRWNHPRKGLVRPGEFVPILEEIGLIFEVGRWALHKAIEDSLRWSGAGLAAVRISVNVSPLQLRQRDFIAEIKRALGSDAQAAAGLELEITESLIMEDVRHNVARLRAIRALGVSIAIDDFGTGFSSLSYLSKLPVDTLKIDRSFVTDMTARPEGLALVSAIINLAHSLKLDVVAEGVETEEQVGLLRLLNCDTMQGYLFSKPVPGEIFEARFLSAPPGG
ncbi:MAG: EAL domain-containing protein [Deferrisomatales bacterium]|nr:EAL domain-containing protein [Deferrisomatales bacterium]